MRKVFVCLMILFNAVCFGAEKLHLMALQDFSSSSPCENFSAEIIEDGTLNGTPVYKGDKIDTVLLEIKDAKRAKIDAKAYFKIVSLQRGDEKYKIESNLNARYAKKIMNKEAVKEVSPKKVVKTVGGAVGGAFIEGFSYGLSFIDGLVTNSEGNRLKSGAKQVYEDSFLSYVEYGDEIDVKEGDTFYFVVKNEDEE